MRKFLTEDDAVLPIHHPRVLLETVVGLGVDRRTVLEGTGITLEALDVPETRISYAQMNVLERNCLAATGEPALGLHAGRAMRLPSAGMLSMAAMSSATGREALDLLLRYHSWLTPGWAWEFQADESRGVLRARELLPRGDLRVFATEWLAVGTNELGKQVIGRSVVTAVRFNYPAPAHAAVYERFFEGIPVEFDAANTEADIDMRLLEASLPGADRAMAVLSERQLATTTVPGASVGGAAEQIRILLAARENTWPDLEEMARTLQTSGRSLRRELRRSNTSYKEVLDEIRKGRAERLVRHTDLTLDRIATQLGFSDVRTFRRAFKRWTGHTPNDVRTRADAPPPSHKQIQ